MLFCFAEQSLQLKAELEAVRVLEEKARCEAHEAETKAEAAVKEWECRICLQNKVEAVLNPCGHAMVSFIGVILLSFIQCFFRLERFFTFLGLMKA